MKKIFFGIVTILTIIFTIHNSQIVTQAQFIGYDETGTMIPATLQMYNDRFITSQPFGVYQTQYDITFKIHIESGSYGIEKTIFIDMDEYLYNEILTWNFYLPKREIMFDYPNDYPSPQITPMYSNITVLDLDTGNYFIWNLSHSTSANVTILFPYEVSLMNNLVVYLTYFNPPTPTGTSPEDMWNMGYASGHEQGLVDGYIQGRNDYGINIDDEWWTADEYGALAYDEGYYYGDLEGYSRGQVEKFNGLTILTSGLFGFLSVLGNFQLLPGFKVGHIVGITMFFGLIYFIMGKAGGRR